MYKVFVVILAVCALSGCADTLRLEPVPIDYNSIVTLEEKFDTINREYESYETIQESPFVSFGSGYSDVQNIILDRISIPLVFRLKIFKW